MEKSEWLVVLFLFSFLYLFTSPSGSSFVSADENQTNITHLECINQACVLVNGSGSDLCKTTKDCLNQTDSVRTVRGNRTVEINLTHLDCVNQACVLVNGTGPDLCKTNQDCLNQTNITHLECVNLACVQVPGNATDQCRTSLDCQNQTNMTGNGGVAAENLPLAPPPQTAPQKPRTLFGYFLRLLGIG